MIFSMNKTSEVFQFASSISCSVSIANGFMIVELFLWIAIHLSSLLLFNNKFLYNRGVEELQELCIDWSQTKHSDSIIKSLVVLSDRNVWYLIFIFHLILIFIGGVHDRTESHFKTSEELNFKLRKWFCYAPHDNNTLLSPF